MEKRQHNKCKQQTPYGLCPSKGPSVRSLGTKQHSGKWIGDQFFHLSLEGQEALIYPQSINPQTSQKDPKRPQNPTMTPKRTFSTLNRQWNDIAANGLAWWWTFPSLIWGHRSRATHNAIHSALQIGMERLTQRPEMSRELCVLWTGLDQDSDRKVSRF